MRNNVPKIVQDDPWLQPYTGNILNRIEAAGQKEKELTGDSELSDFATGYLYFGLHKNDDGWVIREWAPNATYIYLIGSFKH